MQITIDDDVFHKWATERGYTRWADMLALLQEVGDKVCGRPDVVEKQAASPANEVPVWTADIASLEQPEDLKPVNARRLREAIADADAGKLTEFDPTAQPLTDKQTIRLLGELFEHYVNSPEANKACRALLDRYGAAKASEIPPESRLELVYLVSRRHNCATAEEFIASLT
jgi:hypothetical protein